MVREPRRRTRGSRWAALALGAAIIATSVVVPGESATADPVNLLHGRPATQSSTWESGVASRAVDGNTSGDYADGSTASTDSSVPDPWWRVDLGSTTTVGFIEIWNRTDCCSDRLAGFTASLIAADGTTVVWSATQSGALGTTTAMNTGGASGRYLKISLAGSGRILTLSEVRAFAPGAVAVTAPATRTVVQRSGGVGSVPVAGFRTSTAAVEARAVLPGGAAVTGWQTVASAGSGAYSGTLAGVPQGGWYNIEVRAVGGTATVVPKIGVGDVFVTAGQSNSANWGWPPLTPDDRVSARTASAGGGWRLASDPQPIADGSGGSPWSRLGNLLVAQRNVPIGFLSVGVGNTRLDQWSPGTSHYDTRLKPAVQSFPAGGFSAVLWHQGESDTVSATTSAQYEARLNAIIAQARTDAGWQVPWYVATASYLPTTSLVQQLPIVGGQHRVAWTGSGVFAGPRTDDYGWRGLTHDTIHFGDAGLVAHATEWAAVLANTSPTVSNGSFEANPALADGGLFVMNPATNGGQKIIGWEIVAPGGAAPTTAATGYYNPQLGWYAGVDDAGASGGSPGSMAGRHAVFLHGGEAGAAFVQPLARRAVAGATYALTVAVGNRLPGHGFFGRVEVQLLADGAVAATSGVVDTSGLDARAGTSSAGRFTDVGVSWTAPVSALERDLAIRVVRVDGGTDSFLDIDNVRLAVTP